MMNKDAFLKWLAAALLACAPCPRGATGYAQTKYPIILVHGLFGFDNIGPPGNTSTGIRRPALERREGLLRRSRRPTAPRCASSNCSRT